MDRRRFVPSAEGLEGRRLLSTTASPRTPIAAPAQGPAQTNLVQQKTLRIERLPFFLRNVDTDRYLPPELMTRLQADLHAIRGQLTSPPPRTLEVFNETLRDILAEQTLSVEDAQALNRAFGNVLDAAGTPEALEQDLKNVMNELAKVDAQSAQPAILATSDYAITLQTVLGVGRPIRTPNPPSIVQADTIGGKGGRVTGLSQPRLVGSYDAGATIEVVNTATGAVIGAGVVEKNGRYTITVQTPLADGEYTVSTRAVDSGEYSQLSRPFTFEVVTPRQNSPRGGSVPGGPLGLSRV